MTTYAEPLTVPAGLLAELDGEVRVWAAGLRGPSPAEAAFLVEDPATEEPICWVADGSPEDGLHAVGDAHAAFPDWARRAPRERAEILGRAFDLMRADADRLAALISWENGKTLADARAEVLYAAEFFRWYAEEAVRHEGTYGSSPAGGVRIVTTHRPVGVALLVTPWNFPAAMATRKIAPAVAGGCTVVLKPAAETPLTALAIARILRQAGVPQGVVNVVPSSRPGDLVSALLQDSRVRKISFTGSTRVGQVLLRQAADRVVNASMELGGNAPLIVTADADLDVAVSGAMVAKFRNGGQACTAANRFYVHESVAPEFTERFVAATERLVVGPGLDPASTVGPLVSARARAGVIALVEEAVSGGAVVRHRGRTPDRGHFVAPTVLCDVPADAAVLRNEIFGPVAPIVTWCDESEVLDLANESELGLAAYVFAGRLQDAIRIGEGLEAGMVGVNRGAVSDPAAPFGGMKQSGVGREGARHGIREYQETQYLAVDWDH